MTDTDNRNQKIIVALFLILGKALHKVPFKDRNITVSEEEIRQAWSEKKSPVRLVSETVPSFAMNDFSPDGVQGQINSPGGRVFKAVLGDLDMTKTGMKFTRPMPQEPIVKPAKGRVFDLE